MVFMPILTFSSLSALITMKCMKSLNSSESRPEARVTTGVMLGRYRKTQGNKRFSSFTRIPYARPPLGQLRFAKPVPAEPWAGVLDVSGRARVVCPQLNYFQAGIIEGQEDCLYLNVYTPGHTSTYL